MQKLPEVTDRKQGWHMRKRKKASSWQRRTGILSLSSSDQRFDIVADVSRHHAYVFGRSVGLSLSPSSRSLAASFMLKYKRPTNELQTNSYRTLTNFQKKTNLYGSPKYQMRTNTCMKRLTYFWHLKWGIQPFQCIQEKLPHPRNGCWTQQIK